MAPKEQELFKVNIDMMNPSSLDIDFWLRRAKGSAGQSQKDMNRNRPGDEFGETNKWFDSELTEDEATSHL